MFLNSGKPETLLGLSFLIYENEIIEWCISFSSEDHIDSICYLFIYYVCMFVCGICVEGYSANDTEDFQETFVKWTYEISTTTSTASLPSSAPSWGDSLFHECGSDPVWGVLWGWRRLPHHPTIQWAWRQLPHHPTIQWGWRWLPHHPTHPEIPFAEQPIGQRQPSWLLFCGKHPVWQEVFLIWFLPPTSHWSDKIDSLFQASSFTWQHFGDRAPAQCSFWRLCQLLWKEQIWQSPGPFQGALLVFTVILLWSIGLQHRSRNSG